MQPTPRGNAQWAQGVRPLWQAVPAASLSAKRCRDVIERLECRAAFDHEMPITRYGLQPEPARPHHPGSYMKRGVRFEVPGALPEVCYLLVRQGTVLWRAAAVGAARTRRGRDGRIAKTSGLLRGVLPEPKGIAAAIVIGQAPRSRGDGRRHRRIGLGWLSGAASYQKEGKPKGQACLEEKKRGMHNRLANKTTGWLFANLQNAYTVCPLFLSPCHPTSPVR